MDCTHRNPSLSTAKPSRRNEKRPLYVNPAEGKQNYNTTSIEKGPRHHLHNTLLYTLGYMYIHTHTTYTIVNTPHPTTTLSRYTPVSPFLFTLLESQVSGPGPSTVGEASSLQKVGSRSNTRLRGTNKQTDKSKHREVNHEKGKCVFYHTRNLVPFT